MQGYKQAIVVMVTPALTSKMLLVLLPLFRLMLLMAPVVSAAPTPKATPLTRTMIMDDANFKLHFWACLKKELPQNVNRDMTTACDDIPNWDVSRVTDFSALFWEPETSHSNVNSNWVLLPGAATFNVDLSHWHITSKATTLRSMFHSAVAFNQPLFSGNSDTAWDTSSVTDMAHMFQAAKSFDQSLSSLNTQTVTDMSSMFRYAESFQNGDGGDSLNSWKVGRVQHFDFMFHDAIKFDGSGIGMGSWDVSGATDNYHMFIEAHNANTNSSSSHAQQTKDATPAFGYMFQGATAFNTDISQWKIPAATVRSLRYMFDGAESFNQDLSGWNIESITDLSYMFRNATVMNQTLCWNLTVNSTTNSSSPVVKKEGMLQGSIHCRIDTDVEACRADKPEYQPTTTKMVDDIRTAVSQPPSSYLGKGIYVILILAGIAAIGATFYRVIKGRRRKRRIVFRSNKVKEEQIIFNDNGEEAGYVDDEYYCDTDGEQEGEVSFGMEDLPSSRKPTSSSVASSLPPALFGNSTSGQEVEREDHDGMGVMT